MPCIIVSNRFDSTGLLTVCCLPEPILVSTRYRTASTLALTLSLLSAPLQAEPRFETYHFDARSGSSAYLANHDQRGIPIDLDPLRVPVSVDLLDRIALALPEKRDLRQSEVNLITDDEGANITLREEGEVFVTFLHEGAAFQNSFGYIAYDVDEPPRSPAEAEHVVVFPNASHSASGGSSAGLQPGHQVSLGVFPAGTRISFFVVAQGWTPDGVEPFGAPPGWAQSLADSINPSDWVFYGAQWLNPEAGDLAAHTVLLYDPETQQTILGMEDILRTHEWCDHDFNDLLFAVTSNPPTAIATEDLLVLNEVADRDGDGVPDEEDDLPDDPRGAFVVDYPSSHGYATLAFEDNWPKTGDYDLNDLVLRYRLQEIRNIEGDVAMLRGKFQMMARGAGHDSAFGLHFPGLSPDVLAFATVRVDDGPPVALQSEAGQGALTLILMPSAMALGNHSHWCWFFNTQDCQEVKPPQFAFELVFNEPVARADLGNPPYNPFLHLIGHRTHEVHLPNHPPTDLVGSWLIGAYDDDSDASVGRYYLSKDNFPWALNLPVDWHHPKEWVPVSAAYDRFATWAESGGEQAADWYLREHSDPEQLFNRTITGGADAD